MKRVWNTIRVKGAWPMAILFLLLARPTPGVLAAGALLALPGLLIRGWAAGYIAKDRELAVGGPYAHTRNPLYLGSFLLGLGVSIAGGFPVLILLFLGFFALTYTRTIQAETAVLTERFGEAYRAYCREVPPFLPRLSPYRPLGGEGSASGAFSMEQYRRNHEWEAALGVVGGFIALTLKFLFLG